MIYSGNYTNILSDLREGKTLNSKSDAILFIVSVAHCWTILLLSAHPKSVTGST